MARLDAQIKDSAEAELKLQREKAREASRLILQNVCSEMIPAFRIGFLCVVHGILLPHGFRIDFSVSFIIFYCLICSDGENCRYS